MVCLSSSYICLDSCVSLFVSLSMSRLDSRRVSCPMCLVSDPSALNFCAPYFLMFWYPLKYLSQLCSSPTIDRKFPPASLRSQVSAPKFLAAKHTRDARGIECTREYRPGVLSWEAALARLTQHINAKGAELGCFVGHGAQIGVEYSQNSDMRSVKLSSVSVLIVFLLWAKLAIYH